jgi:hypothetical protein
MKINKCRPITALLVKLICYEKFREASKYYEKMYTTEEIFADALDGNCAYEALTSMTNSYEHKVEITKELTGYVNSMHLFSEFYDGAQLFDNRVSNFHALVISLLNLPPPYRTKNGCGSFVIAVHTLPETCRAESILVERLFVEELNLLRNGLKVTIGGIKYFVQARCINHLWDTPALAKNVKAKVSNAKNSCILCGGMKGVYRHCFRHYYYMGHRACLPMTHVLRWYGKSGKCCPSGYYSGESTSAAVLQVQNLFHVTKTNARNNEELPRTNRVVSYVPNKTSGCDMNADEILEAMESAKRPSLWYHDDYAFENTGFAATLSYPHADLRAVIKTDHITNTEYRNRAGGDMKDQYGYKSIWPFDGVSKWDHLMWEPFHAIKNCCDSILCCLRGDRANSNTIRLLCKAERVHDSLWCPNMSKKPIWELSTDIQDYLDSLMASILYPYGTETEFQIINPFRQMGFMRGTQRIKFISTFLPTLLSFTKLSTEYRVFVHMFSRDIADLLSFVVHQNEVASLADRIMETVSVKEGLFPDSESNFIWHQLTDIPAHIIMAGPIMSWWGAFGERILGELKR